MAQSPSHLKHLKFSSTWTRTGCITCKRRRKKCDQQKPTCLNCAKYGVDCEGYQHPFVFQPPPRPKRSQSKRKPRLVSHNASLPHSIPSPSMSINPGPIPQPSAAVASGLNVQEPEQLDCFSRWQPQLEGYGDVSHGPAVVQSPSLRAAATTIRPERDQFVEDLPSLQSDQTDPFDLISQSVALGDAGTVLSAGTSRLNLPATGVGLNMRQCLSPFPDFSDLDFYYLQYFYERVAGHLLNVDSGSSNPLRRLILPRASHCTGLLNSICAVAACHQAQLSDSDAISGFSDTGTRFYLNSVNWLRHSVSQRVGNSPLAVDGTPILVALLLCMYEIIKGNGNYWRDHLNGLDHMFQAGGGLESLEPECGHYVATFIQYHRLTSDLALNQSLSTATDSYLNTAASESSIPDTYSGCASHLLQACHAISRFSSRVEVQEITALSEIAAEVVKIVDSLGTPVIESNIRVAAGEISFSSISRLIYVAQRLRYAAFVYLHTALVQAGEGLGFSDSQSEALRQQIPYTQEQALDGCFEMLDEIPVGEHCEFAALVLPLFLAGCEVKDGQRRYLILDRLFAMQRSFGLGHIARVKDALSIIWQRSREERPKAWWEILREQGRDVILC